MKLFANTGKIYTFNAFAKKKGRRPKKADMKPIVGSVLVEDKGEILWVGKKNQIPLKYKSKIKKIVDLEGRNVFPGFVDCHTHLVFAGNRREEFEMRMGGASYQQIAKAGGGILSTVSATRKASLNKLVGLASERLAAFTKQGCTTIEVKSGYGLDKKNELKMLRAVSKLKSANLVCTFLGAHAIPKGKTGGSYLSELGNWLTDVKKTNLATRVDIFIEKGYFSVKQAREYLSLAQSMGFDLTIHADQITRTGAARLGVELGAKSVDHVVCVNAKDVDLIAKSETTAVLLPSADFYLKMKYPPARKLIDKGACVALATDFNPGSSPTQNLGFVGLLARLEMSMTLPEIWSAFTVGGAHALGIEDRVGSLESGKSCDFFTSSADYQDFFYDLAALPVSQTWCRGRRSF